MINSNEHLLETNMFVFCQVLASLGWAVYRGLDYGLPDDEERDLQDDLERLIMCMTHKGEREDIDFDSVIQVGLEYA